MNTNSEQSNKSSTTLPAWINAGLLGVSTLRRYGWPDEPVEISRLIRSPNGHVILSGGNFRMAEQMAMSEHIGRDIIPVCFIRSDKRNAGEHAFALPEDSRPLSTPERAQLTRWRITPASTGPACVMTNPLPCRCFCGRAVRRP